MKVMFKIDLLMHPMLLQLVPVWDSTQCGQYRSIVRMIGTNLPLSPYPRLRFQVNKSVTFYVNQLQLFASVYLCVYGVIIKSETSSTFIWHFS